MASLQNSEMAIKTARAGIARAGISRANVTTVDTEVEFAPFTRGNMEVHRPRPYDGDPVQRGTWTVQQVG